jgi:hypothetical protein
VEGIDRDALRPLASECIGWKTPGEALALPERAIAQAMNIGDYDDVRALVRQVGDAVLRQVLADAEAGQFTARSWAYWPYRLGLARIGHVPALPVRRVA